MTSEPLSQPPREISVTEAIEPAFNHMKRMLFQPFDLSRWIVIGFCAWLAGFCESGGGAQFNFGNFGSDQNNPAEHFRRVYHHSADYVLVNLAWIVPLAVFCFLLLLALGVLLLWLSSAGKFMFLHCVALNRAEVDIPWHKHRRAANSLFRFRLVLALAALVAVLPLVILALVEIAQMVLRNELNYPGLLLAIGAFLFLVPLSIVLALIRKLTTDFVVPILYLRGGTCLDAWREFWRQLLVPRLGEMIIYVLFQIVIHLVIGVIVIAVFVLTCCIACCIACLPFIGTVLLLPVLIFKRAYSLFYLAQFGPQYGVFPPSLPADPPQPAPAA